MIKNTHRCDFHAECILTLCWIKPCCMYHYVLFCSNVVNSIGDPVWRHVMVSVDVMIGWSRSWVDAWASYNKYEWEGKGFKHLLEYSNQVDVWCVIGVSSTFQVRSLVWYWRVLFVSQSNSPWSYRLRSGEVAAGREMLWFVVELEALGSDLMICESILSRSDSEWSGVCPTFLTLELCCSELRGLCPDGVLDIFGVWVVSLWSCWSLSWIS